MKGKLEVGTVGLLSGLGSHIGRGALRIRNLSDRVSATLMYHEIVVE